MGTGIEFLWKGAVIGVSIAAPVGPIGVLCIRRSVADGFAIGFATGLGAAIADAAYGCVAAFGLTAISSFLVNQRFWLGLIGGVFLCYLGLRTFFTRPAKQAAGAKPARNMASACASTVLLTLTNPMTILSFVAVFAGFGLGAVPDYGAASVLVLGVFAGSALWWLTLSSVAGAFRGRVNEGWMRRVNRVSGAVILAFGIRALFSVQRF